MYFIIDFKSKQEIRKAKIDDSDSLKRVNYYEEKFCLFSCRIVNYRDGDVIQVCLERPILI